MARSKRAISRAIVFVIFITSGLTLLQVTFNHHLVIVGAKSVVDVSIFPAQLILSHKHPKINQNDSHSTQVRRDPSTSTALLQEGNNDVNKLLLSVPFYVYEELVWNNARWDGKPILEFVHGSQPKHTDDFWFMKNALRHPMRTFNASEAKLFVIPSLHNLFDSRVFFKTRNLCVRSLCNSKLMLSAAKVVTSSRQFQTHPEAHLAVVSHFAHHKDWWTNGMPKLYLSMLQQSSNIHFEDFPTNNGWSVPKIHVGRPCPLQTNNNKTQDVALIATFKPDDERFRDRETICSWLQNHSSTIRLEQCGWGEMCPALASAKLGFHVRGDTPSSSRLFDTILSGTVPIFTLQKQYEVLPDWIEWNRISYFMDMATLNETAFIDELHGILKDTKTYQSKLDLLLANRHLFDWTGLYPFDTYMYMLQAYLYPDTRHDPSIVFAPTDPTRSILRLPPRP